MTIEMYPSDQVADLRAEVTHWYENLQKEQMNQQAQLQEFGQSSRQQGDFPGQQLSRAAAATIHCLWRLTLVSCSNAAVLPRRWPDGSRPNDFLGTRADHGLRREDSA